jgi:glucan phosphorylase
MFHQIAKSAVFILMVRYLEISGSKAISRFYRQVKRMHEYKRQLLNVLYTIHRYLEIKAMPHQEREKIVKRDGGGG